MTDRATSKRLSTQRFHTQKEGTAMDRQSTHRNKKSSSYGTAGATRPPARPANAEGGAAIDANEQGASGFHTRKGGTAMDRREGTRKAAKTGT